MEVEGLADQLRGLLVIVFAERPNERLIGPLAEGAAPVGGGLRAPILHRAGAISEVVVLIRLCARGLGLGHLLSRPIDLLVKSVGSSGKQLLEVIGRGFFSIGEEVAALSDDLVMGLFTFRRTGALALLYIIDSGIRRVLDHAACIPPRCTGVRGLMLILDRTRAPASALNDWSTDTLSKTGSCLPRGRILLVLVL